MNYDPNLTNSGRNAVQKVKLTFGTWEYRTEMTAVVGGNCRGLMVIESAVSAAFDQLPTHKYSKELEAAYLTLRNGEDELECEDEDGGGAEWLKGFLIGAEIIEIRQLPDSEF